MKNTRTGVSSGQETNTSGFYRFSSLVPGDYEPQVKASGFRVSTISVLLTTGQTRDLNVSLEVQRAVESVSVTAEAPTLGTVGNSPRNAFRQQDVLAIALAAS